MSDDHIRKAFEQARGIWPRILQAAGIAEQHLTRRPGPCPMCGGEDRFVYDNRRGNGDYICRQCGAGDGIVLLRKYRGWSFREAFQHIERMAGMPSYVASPAETIWRPAGKKVTTPRQFWAMARLWGRGSKTSSDDLVGVYLTARSIGLSPRVQNLRTLSVGDGEHLEMLARVQDVDGRVVQLHRTVLCNQGEVLRPERKLMPGVHPAGSAVRLYEVEQTLGIAEGIENALSAANMFQMPVWAALTAGRLAKFEPPNYVDKLEVFADDDENGVGQSAAHELVSRMKARGLKAIVRMPPATGVDWNDMLCGAMAGADQNLSQ